MKTFIIIICMSENKKNKIFSKIQPYLINNKFSDEFIDEIITKEKISKEDFYINFPEKTKSICLYFFEKNSIFIKQTNKKRVSTEKSIGKKVTFYLEKSFVFFEKNSETTLFFLNYFITHPCLFNKISRNFANLVWVEIKDKSLDFNYYTKRYILSKIFQNSLFYWRHTSDNQQTMLFVENQISSLSIIGKFKKKSKDIIDKLRIQNLLSKLDFMH